MDWEALKAPFDPDEVEWRVGSTTQDKKKGMALAYIDARAVMDRLDTVCGPENWQCKYTGVGDKTCCEIGVYVPAFNEWPGGWIWKADGAGDTDFEGAKGAFSDAFKRAAVKWGIGRYLYDMKAPWVQITQRGKSFVIAEHEKATLRQVLEGGNPKGSPPSNSRDPNWAGEFTKTELVGELKRFAEHLADGVHMPEELDNLLDEYQTVLDDCKKNMPGWWAGEGMPQEFVPIERRIAAKREFLNAVQMTSAG